MAYTSSSPAPPALGLSCDLQPNIPDDLELKRDNGITSFPFGLSATASLTEDGKAVREKMCALMSARGTVTVHGDFGLDDSQFFSSLRLNGVSLFYAFIKAHVEMTTEQALTDRSALPSLDP